MFKLFVVLLLLILCVIVFACLNRNAFMRFLRVLGRYWAGLKRKTVQVNTCRWVYLDNEVEAKPVLLLLHGFGADKDNWLSYARAIGKQYRVIVPDIQGFGESYSDTQLSYRALEQVQRLKQFCECLGLSQVHLCGNSMGGFFAGLFSAEYPESVSSLVLMNAAGLPADKTSLLDHALQQGKSPLIPHTMAEVDELLRIVAGKPMTVPRWIKGYMLQQVLDRDVFLQAAFGDLLIDHKSSLLGTRLHEISAPTLVMWGREDKLLDVSAAYNAAAKLTNSSLIVFDNVGHIPMVEATHKAWAEHRQWLNNNSDNTPR